MSVTATQTGSSVLVLFLLQETNHLGLKVAEVGLELERVGLALALALSGVRAEQLVDLVLDLCLDRLELVKRGPKEGEMVHDRVTLQLPTLELDQADQCDRGVVLEQQMVLDLQGCRAAGEGGCSQLNELRACEIAGHNTRTKTNRRLLNEGT